ELPSDPPAEKICLEDCELCINSCPSEALNSSPVDQKACRTNTYGTNARGFSTVNCNKCRTVCPMKFGVTPVTPGRS
ncbi:MAG TPA: epoxyqueuosine reductase, partial [Syntrophomonas sp.]|nr:epoxyqueuosine reductase [Syntrophomonas sp.]